MLMSKVISLDSSKMDQSVLGSAHLDISTISQQDLNLSEEEGRIDNFYIEMGQPLQQFSTDFANAYAVVSSTTSEELGGGMEASYYALVFKKHLPIRLSEIRALKSYTGNNLITPATYGITPINSSTGESSFVAIMPRPQGKSVEDLLKSGIKFDENFLLHRFIRPILNALNHLHQHSITHGNLNPSTIFIDSSGDITLGECVSEACGYSQTPFYETIERSQTDPFGKGAANEKVDYYALGCTLFTLLTGKNFAQYDAKDLLRAKLQSGTYALIAQNANMIGKIGDLIKGLVIDAPAQRWSYIDIDAFLQGRNSSTESLTDHNYVSRAIVFNSKEFYSKRSLSHEMAQNWDAAKEFLKTDKIKKWLEVIHNSDKFVEMYVSFQANFVIGKMVTQKIFSTDDERLIRTLVILDPLAPIRIRNTAFHKEALGLMMLSSLNNGQGEVTQLLAGALFCNLFSVYEFLATSLGDPSYITNLLPINKCVDFIKKTEPGLGFERCLYELNPTLPCQATPLNKEFCIGIKDVLRYLEGHSVPFEEILSKKAISGFLGAKLHLTSEAKSYELNDVPSLQKSRAFQLTLILSTAQKQTKLGKLEHSCSIMKDAILDALDTVLKSSAIKKQIHSDVFSAAKSGDLFEVYKAGANSALIQKDLEGYGNALRRGAQIAQEIFSYDNRTLMFYDIKRKSLNIAVKFSYIVSCFIIILLLLGRA